MALFHLFICVECALGCLFLLMVNSFLDVIFLEFYVEFEIGIVFRHNISRILSSGRPQFTYKSCSRPLRYVNVFDAFDNFLQRFKNHHMIIT